VHPVLFLHDENLASTLQEFVPTDLTDEFREEYIGFRECTSEGRSGETKEGDICVGRVGRRVLFVENSGSGDELFHREMRFRRGWHAVKVAFVVGKHGAGVESEESLRND